MCHSPGKSLGGFSCSNLCAGLLAVACFGAGLGYGAPPARAQGVRGETQILIPQEARQAGAVAQPGRNFKVPAEAMENSESHRVISLYNIHTKETLTVLYKKNGRYIPSAMKRIYHLMRDWRRNEPRRMDHKLIDLIWSLQTELKPKGPVHLISGYRSLKTNNMLRRTRGGQAKRSRHILGKAADLHFPGVPIKKLRHAALRRQIGGVGYYPTSALPFVHVDTGRVRHWPRIDRIELAMIFPDGRTRHVPRGGPLRPRDLRIARARLARMKARPVMVAKSSPSRRRRLMASVYRDLAEVRALKAHIRKLWVYRTGNEGLLRQAALTTRAPARSGNARHWPKLWVNRSPANRPALVPDNLTFVWDSTSSIRISAAQMPGFNPVRLSAPRQRQRVELAPEWDEDHPDELNYRPVSLLPLMGETPLASDRHVVAMSEPVYDRSQYLFDEPENMIVLQMRHDALWGSRLRVANL